VERGRSVRLEDLQLTGLADDAVKQEGARQFACPNCGAPVLVKLDSTKSITCPSCASLITLDGGVGGELRHALQDEPVQPLIALGRTGQLEGSSWQVVGFQHRLGRSRATTRASAGPNTCSTTASAALPSWWTPRTAGAWCAPPPARPLGAGGRSASYLGRPISCNRATAPNHLRAGRVLLARAARAENHQPRLRQRGRPAVDGANAGRNHLVLRQPAQRRHRGRRLRPARPEEPFERNTVGPFVASKGVGCMTIIVIIIIFVVIASILDSCAGSSGGYGRSSGGSYGGYSSGGSHK
jgi:DNA-directed RNA polymerase subunit RPC12/RpoP